MKTPPPFPYILQIFTMYLRDILLFTLGVSFCTFVAADPSTFWVQADCLTPAGKEEGTSFTTALAEAKRFARSAALRLANNNDQDAQNLWNLIFGTTNNQFKPFAISEFV
jgi:hypothetical protein